MFGGSHASDDRAKVWRFGGHRPIIGPAQTSFYRRVSMSQIPPPPPGQPAPTGGSGAVGSNKNLYTILAWALLPPIGSLIFLFVGKDDPDVKYNAAQALVIHGGAFIVWLILWVLTIIVLPLVFLLLLWVVLWFAICVVGLIMALQARGVRGIFPVVGRLAGTYLPGVAGRIRES